MQPYDLFMIVVLVGATLFGLMKGMAWQMASLGSIILSYLVALTFSEPLAPLFHTQAPWNRFLAMAVLYVLTSFAVWFVFRIVAGAIDRIRLKDFDRQVGAIFGLCKGVLLCVAITFFAVTLSATARGSVLKSKSGGYIAVLLNKADAVMPKELHAVLEPYMEKLERGLDPNQGDLETAEEGGRWRDTFQNEVRRGVDAARGAVEESMQRRFSEPEPRANDSNLNRDFGRNWTSNRSDQPASRYTDDRGRYDDDDERDADADRPASRY
jgi:membrane protein required for colicin V production